LLSAILFAIVTAVNTGGVGTVNLNFGFLRVFTLVLFVASVLLSFIVTSVDSERIGIDIDQVRRAKKDQIADLNKEVDKLMGGGK
jgi:ABC-type methionine transport system permease subunit